MLRPCSSRWFYFAEFLVIVGLLGFAYYLEYYEGILPCALCSLQRVVFAALGVIFLFCAIFRLNRVGSIVMNIFICLVALLGVLLAGRQVWLQYAPVVPNNSTCDASLLYLLKIMPLSDVIMNVFLGGPECARVTWQFLHLSIAEWSLLWFAFFVVVALWKCCCGSSRNKIV